VARFFLRLLLVALVLLYVFPVVDGVRFTGDLIGAAAASTTFNLILIGLEWLLAAIVFGVNIGTLGLGVILASGIRFLMTGIAPVVALVGTAQVLPGAVQVVSLFPGALAGGLLLGALVWLTALPVKRRR